ncbi:MAG: GNAT family N-acetyltransferase [Bacteroidetes bacterium]|nr:MAG: GNAT family N-acetyltransferase [Bacteroidota bacterium]
MVTREPVYREVERGDNPLLARMIREVFEEHEAPRVGTVYSDPTTDDLYGLFRKERSVLFVAEIDGKPAGCCGVYPSAGLPVGVAELVKFYLAAGARGKGTGRKLMELSIRKAREFGYKQLYLESLPQYARAIGIYEKQGFTPLERPMGKWEHNACNIWMIKEL